MTNEERIKILEEQLAQATATILLHRMVLSLWSSTFQKYESWQTNKCDNSFYPDSVVNDYKAMSALNRKVI